MLSRTLSGVLLRGLWSWGEWPLGSEKQGVFSVSEGEITSSISHCRRTSRDFKGISTHINTNKNTGSLIHQFHCRLCTSTILPSKAYQWPLKKSFFWELFGDLQMSKTHCDGGVGVVLAEAVQDDVGTDAHHAEDTTLWAPSDHLNSIRVFLHQLSASPHLSSFWLLKHFWCLELIQHLQCDW